MAFACNIDRKGRVARAIYGVLILLAGVLWLLFSWPPAWWEWALAGLLILGGVFALIEAKLSWCAIRALGFRTPM